MNKHLLYTLITIGISVICFIFLHRSDALDDAGMAAIILNWLPFILALGTMALYFMMNAITKKYAWIIIVLGNALNVVSLISALMS